VWWAWNYTAWATSWVDPDRRPTALAIAGVFWIGAPSVAQSP
jgi:hypothetical protein